MKNLATFTATSRHDLRRTKNRRLSQLLERALAQQRSPLKQPPGPVITPRPPVRVPGPPHIWQQVQEGLTHLGPPQPKKDKMTTKTKHDAARDAERAAFEKGTGLKGPAAHNLWLDTHYR